MVASVMQLRSWLLICATLPIWSDAVRAETPDPTAAVDLAVYAPPNCPRAIELRQRLAARLTDKQLAASRVVVTIAETEDESRPSLEIQIIGADGNIAEPRRLSGSSCDELLTAAALILSIALVPADEVDPSDGLAQIEIDDATERDLKFTRPPTPTRDRASLPVVVRLGAATAIDSGTMPEVAPGIGVVAALAHRFLRVELAALYFPKRRTIADSTLMAGGDLSAYTTTARACLKPASVFLCGGGEWSLVTATGVGTDNTATETFYLWGLAVGSRWEARLGERVVFAIAGELVARPQRPEFRISNPDRIVHRPGWLSARLWLSGEVAIF